MTSSRRHLVRPFAGPKLATMLLLLGVVGLLTYNAGDPRNWKWVEELPPDEAAATITPATPGGQNNPRQERFRYDATSQNYNESKVQPDNPTDPNFHWDQDPEEKAEIKRELSVVTDGTLQLRPEEMHAYGRFLRWVKTRSYQDLLKYARNDWTYNDFVQSTKKMRGNLFRLPLNIVRVLEHEFTDPTTRETTKIYELIGWHQDSSSRLYYVIVPELPEGMPIANKIEEQATVVGYFMKMQGYEDGLAKPGAPPEKAPFLIGRLAWEPQIRRIHPVRNEGSRNWTWWILGGLFVGYIGLRWWLQRGSPKRESVAEILANKDRSPDIDNDKIASWLEHADSNSIPADPEDEQAEILSANLNTSLTNSQNNNRSEK